RGACRGPNRGCRAARSKWRSARAKRRYDEEKQRASCAASAEGGATDSCCGGSCSGQATHQLNTFRSEAVGMTRRNAVLGGYPLGFEEREFGEAHENRVERAGLKSRFPAQFVAVAPGG